MLIHSNSNSAHLYDRASLALFLGITAIVLFTLNDYGMSWDEWFRWRGGQEKLLYYQMLFSGGEAIPESPTPNGNYYPGFFDLTVALLSATTGFGLFITGHIVSAFLGLVGIIAVWAIARQIGGARAGFWAALFVVLMPRYYGHLFFNPKDIPFAATYLCALYILIRLAPQLPRPSWKATIAMGIAIGFCVATRVGGIILIGYAGLAALAALWLTIRQGQVKREEISSTVGLLVLKALIMIFVAWLTVLPWWPYAHHHPIMAFVQAITTVGQFPWNGPVLYLGETYNAIDLPWHYPVVWLMITIPVVFLFILAAGVLLFITGRGKVLVQSPMKWMQLGILLFAALFPVFYTIIKDATIYDGIRHLLFVFPLTAILTAIAFEAVIRWVSRFNVKWTLGVQAVVVVGCVPVIWVMIQLHPYQYVYFNEPFGGLSEAEGVMETEYWGVSYREAVEGLDSYLNSLGPDALESPAVFMGYPGGSGEIFMPHHWQKLKRYGKADFTISTTRWNVHKQLPGKEIFVVERYGVPFNVVGSMDGFNAKPKPAEEADKPEVEE